MTDRAPDPRTARTRAAIIAATSELLATSDGASVSVAQIAQQASVSVGSVYVHFDSKDELVAQVIELAWARHSTDFAAVRELESPLDRVFAFGDALLLFARREPVAYRALRLRAIDPPHPSSTTERSLLATPLEFVRADVAEAMAVGEIAGSDPAQVANLLFATWSGIAEQYVRRDGLGLRDGEAEALPQLLRSVLGAGLRPTVAVAT